MSYCFNVEPLNWREELCDSSSIPFTQSFMERSPESKGETSRVDQKENDDGCALNRITPVEDSNSCTALVPYDGGTPITQLSWEADSSWSLRMLRLLIECARLKMLMAWCSTLGGAHSSLGERSLSHAEVAGVISGQQLSLAIGLRDPLMAARCKLYLAYSLLQQGRLKQANKLIKEQYRYITKEAMVKDIKLVRMCLAAWERLGQLQRTRGQSYSHQQTLPLQPPHGHNY